MRFVIFGAGAIGGAVGARLAEGGFEVALIARGAHLEAIRRDGLRFETPVQRDRPRAAGGRGPGGARRSARAETSCCCAPRARTRPARSRRCASPAPGASRSSAFRTGSTTSACALRSLESVYGAVVMLPAAHLEPGTVLAYGSQLTGIIDVGRYPDGSDELCELVTDALAGVALHLAAPRRHHALQVREADPQPRQRGRRAVRPRRAQR